MHHYLTGQLATSHRHSLLEASHQRRKRAAARTGRRAAGRGRHRPVRYRAGWALVELGLRLAGTPHSA
jgi:hypothetical protein